MSKEKTNGIYTKAQKKVYAAVLAKSTYAVEVQEILAKAGKTYNLNYIQRAFSQLSGSERVWDAIAQVALARQAKRNTVKQQTEQLVENESAAA